jgi:hypothetical protein
MLIAATPEETGSGIIYGDPTNPPDGYAMAFTVISMSVSNCMESLKEWASQKPQTVSERMRSHAGCRL